MSQMILAKVKYHEYIIENWRVKFNTSRIVSYHSRVTNSGIINTTNFIKATKVFLFPKQPDGQRLSKLSRWIRIYIYYF